MSGSECACCMLLFFKEEVSGELIVTPAIVRLDDRCVGRVKELWFCA